MHSSKSSAQQGRCAQGPYEGATCAPTNNSGFSHVNNSQVGQWNSTLQFYRTLKEKYNTYLTVPDPYWMSGGTNKEPMGYTDAWNHIPSDTNGTLEYLTMGRMYLCEPLPADTATISLSSDAARVAAAVQMTGRTTSLRLWAGWASSSHGRRHRWTHTSACWRW